MFNHASYGLATSELLARTEELRRELESDPNVNLGESLQERLAQSLSQVCAWLGLDASRSALTTSATAGAAALQRSIPLSAGDVVMALDCEYSSVVRGWQRRCDEVDAQLVVVPVELPLEDVEVVLERMTGLAGERVAVLQFSAITSSAALRLPVQRLTDWGHDRGAVVVVDAAHGPGQVDVAGWDGVDAAFGTLHKWLPVPRSVGILWTSPELAALVRPAEVSLSYDDPSLGRRFSWPGTFDPAVRLALPDAVAVQNGWIDTGQIGRCEKLADYAQATLAQSGATPTAGARLSAPRMRAFLLPGVPLHVLRQRLFDAGIRAWTGEHASLDGHQRTTLLRLATHVFQDVDDVDVVAREVAAVLAGGPALR